MTKAMAAARGYSGGERAKLVGSEMGWEAWQIQVPFQKTRSRLTICSQNLETPDWILHWAVLEVAADTCQDIRNVRPLLQPSLPIPDLPLGSAVLQRQAAVGDLAACWVTLLNPMVSYSTVKIGTTLYSIIHSSGERKKSLYLCGLSLLLMKWGGCAYWSWHGNITSNSNSNS